jgi:DNA replication and repair protein RecF
MKGEEEIPLAVYRSSSGLAAEECENIEKTREAYTKLLTTKLEREIAAGSTLWGIHKDDIEILLNGRSARMFASQGQQRSLALSMKLAEGEVCNQVCGEMPVFLFDDVFSELDEGRRSFLSDKLEGKQVIITSCDTDCVKNKDMILVNRGSYSRMSR